jgi:hypothetical protein
MSYGRHFLTGGHDRGTAGRRRSSPDPRYAPRAGLHHQRYRDDYVLQSGLRRGRRTPTPVGPGSVGRHLEVVSERTASSCHMISVPWRSRSRKSAPCEGSMRWPGDPTAANSAFSLTRRRCSTTVAISPAPSTCLLISKNGRRPKRRPVAPACEPGGNRLSCVAGGAAWAILRAGLAQPARVAPAGGHPRRGTRTRSRGPECPGAGGLRKPPITDRPTPSAGGRSASAGPDGAGGHATDDGDGTGREIGQSVSNAQGKQGAKTSEHPLRCQL